MLRSLICERRPCMGWDCGRAWKRWPLLAGLLPTVVLCSLLGCGSQEPSERVALTPFERQWLEEHRNELAYGVLPDYAPIEFLDDNGLHTGLTADYLREIERGLGVEFKRVPTHNWTELLSKAKSGEILLLGSIQATPERSEYLSFSEIYVEIPNVIIVRDDSSQGLSLDDMTGMSVAAVAGYANTDYLKLHAPNLDLILVRDTETGLQRVSFGQVEALVADLAAASHYIDALGITNLRVAGKIPFSWKLRFGCRRDEPQLQIIVNKGLRSITSEKRETIRRRWISVRTTTWLDRKVAILIVTVLLGTAVVMGAVTAWNRSLRRQVSMRTQDLEDELKERHRIEDALREQEENLRITLDSIGDAVVAVDETGCVVRLNPQAEQLTGWSFEQARGRSMEEVFRLVDERGEDLAPASVETALTDYVSKENTLRTKGGAVRVVAHSKAAIRDSRGYTIGTVLVFRDVTEDHLLREQLHQAQKLESIGQLAGGVAHDFNNLLAGIIGFAEMLQLERPTDPVVTEYVGSILNASERAAELTKQLLAFSRKGKFEVRPIDLNGVVLAVFRLLERSVDPRIELRQELNAQEAVIMGDPSQVQNALLNLCVNARDAMPEGGTLTVSTRTVELTEQEALSIADELAPGRYVALDVSDTGIGMDADVQKRIFEPFFTTKTEGRGTGLGLASVYGCLANHQGSVSVVSAPGRGSTFKLLLPCSGGVALPEQEPVVEPSMGTGRILVIDDDPRIRAFTSTCLGGLGYEVKTCLNGLEAIKLFEDGATDFDLVILDLVMPKVSGSETFKRLRKLAPGLKVLLISGFTEEHAASLLMQEGALRFLSKPFRVVELSEAVAFCIESTRTNVPTPALRAQ